MIKDLARGVFIAAQVLVIAACTSMGGSNPTPAASPGQPVPQPPITSQVYPSLKDTRGARQVLEPQAPLLDAKPITVNYTPSSGGMVVHFSTGDTSCYGVEGYVLETDDKVVVEFQEGVFKRGVHCTAISLFLEAEVRLEAPLGSRKVVDIHGAALEKVQMRS